MQWDFTAQDVVKARVGYGLAEFRGDLRREVRMNLPGLDEATRERVFALIYDLTYWLATGKTFEEFEAAFESSGFTQLFLARVREQGEDNVAMLGAILQRQIMDRVESGTPVQHAVAEVGAWHARLVAADAVAGPAAT